MAVLEILEFPDPRLRTKAKPVTAVTHTTRRLIADMLETMYDAPGIGLAATQVNVHERILVIDVSDARNDPLVFINPEITVLDPELGQYDEGCLSVPGFYETVCRPGRVSVTAMDGDGQSFTRELDGLLAICLQHEIDHLEGKLFVDYLSPLKRQRIRKKLEKQQRQNA
ncbi:MAG: peptide deformylase [Halioglobus sp.]|jgi:peptide deformylase|nr:peptide deformylase [Halioglobus sp.]